MKYWWLEKYKEFKIIQIKELQDDVNYFLTMPKNFIKKNELLKNEDIDNLNEEELLILLKKIVTTKNIKDSSLNKIIKKLLQVPDNSFPKSDYSLEEMLDEIKKLKENYPYQEKLENNNIAICYNCLNIFYVDKIKSVNKNNLCLCPYCLKTKLYFDNDYIPMNYTFIKLANIYYGVSKLGCTFNEVKKIVKKSIKTSNDIKTDKTIDLTDIFYEKINPIDEKIISKKIYDLLIEKDKNFEYEVTIYIKDIKKEIELKLLILLVSIIEVLSNSIYIKKVKLLIDNKKVTTTFNTSLKILTNYH